MKQALPVSIRANNSPLRGVLDEIFSAQPLKYVINRKTIIVSKKIISANNLYQSVTVTGQVTDESGDATFLNNRLFVNFDMFNRLTDGILYRLPLPPSVGDVNSAILNIAKVANDGWELNLEHRNQVGALISS